MKYVLLLLLLAGCTTKPPVDTCIVTNRYDVVYKITKQLEYGVYAEVLTRPGTTLIHAGPAEVMPSHYVTYHTLEQMGEELHPIDCEVYEKMKETK